MRKTIFLPDDLNAKLEEYLRSNPSETPSSMFQEFLRWKLPTKRPLSALLDLAGAFSYDPANEAANREDIQPEDEWAIRLQTHEI
jgi:hypothetical protein